MDGTEKATALTCARADDEDVGVGTVGILAVLNVIDFFLGGSARPPRRAFYSDNLAAGNKEKMEQKICACEC